MSDTDPAAFVKAYLMGGPHPARAAELREREAFVAEHLRVCTARRCRKYDRKKRKTYWHTLAYSRRKCAKHLWAERRKARKRQGT